MRVPFFNVSRGFGAIAAFARDAQILDAVRSAFGQRDNVVGVAIRRSERIIAPKASGRPFLSPAAFPFTNRFLISDGRVALSGAVSCSIDSTGFRVSPSRIGRVLPEFVSVPCSPFLPFGFQAGAMLFEVLRGLGNNRLFVKSIMEPFLLAQSALIFLPILTVIFGDLWFVGPAVSKRFPESLVPISSVIFLVVAGIVRPLRTFHSAGIMLDSTS